VSSSGQTGWLHMRPLGHSTYAIDDNGRDMMYLVAGGERCAVIDTGFGIGDLASLVAEVTVLPVIVVNTHGHVDHVSGNGAFSVAYVGEGDLPGVSSLPPEEMRQGIRQRFANDPLLKAFNWDTWGMRVAGKIVPIKDGHVFDLGNRTLEVISLPGHTPGSLCLLDRSTRFLFTGDSIHGGTLWLHLRDSLPLHKFHDHLVHLRSYAAEFDTLLPGHAKPENLPLPAKTLDDLIAGIELILAGELVGRPETTFVGDGLRCDFASCGILYRPDRL